MGPRTRRKPPRLPGQQKNPRKKRRRRRSQQLNVTVLLLAQPKKVSTLYRSSCLAARDGLLVLAAEIVGADVGNMPRLRSAAKKVEAPPKPTRDNTMKRTAKVSDPYRTFRSSVADVRSFVRGTVIFS